MENEKQLYRTALNPLLIKPERGLPSAVAVIGAGTIGPERHAGDHPLSRRYR